MICGSTKTPYPAAQKGTRMQISDPQRATELRSLIADFLTNRLNDKLEKLAADDPKRAELQQQFHPSSWLEDAARRVGQIQAVTHSLKPIHPDARGTNIYSSSTTQQKDRVLPVVGSHCLGGNFASDVVGNAAALDVYKFLKLEYQGRSLLALVLEQDASLAAALSDDPLQARNLMAAFAGLTEPRGQVSSHTLAKQLYWMAGGDPHENASFHLLAPLYASSLAQRVYQVVQDDRFSDEATAARKAKREGGYSERPVREYPNLAIQKLGGTKPQNISQLNSERRGENLLFASLPPTWRSASLKPLLHTDTLFHRFGRRPDVRDLLRSLLAFLKSDPSPNMETRERRTAWEDAIIDEFFQFSAELRALPAGWSQLPECQLSRPEKHWLDPEGVKTALMDKGLPLPTDTQEQVSFLFANWLNAQLDKYLPVGDPEYLEWRKRLLDAIKAEEWETPL